MPTTLQKKIKKIRQENEKSCAAVHSENRRTERTPRKCCRCGSKYCLIAKYTKPPKDNEKRQNKVCFNENFIRACNNGKNNSAQKIYASMTRMSGNDKCPSENFGDSSQFTNWILDSGAKCHMTLEVSYFIPG